MTAPNTVSAAGEPAAPVRRPKVGLYLPTADTMFDGATARWSDLRAMTQTAEAVGFDSLWFCDHFLAHTPSGPVGTWECWSILAAVAAVTNRVDLGSMVSCTTYRNPALLAKMADTIDEISGGRLILGVGAGWMEDDFRTFGFPSDHLVSRFAEAVTIIHALLRGQQVDFAGEYYQVRDCELRPRGPRAEGPPLLIGANGERMLDLTARHADIWDTNFRSLPELPALQGALDAACGKAGRSPVSVARSASVFVAMPGANHPFGAPSQLSGPLDAIAEGLRAYADAGFSQLMVWLAPNTPAGVEAFAPVLDRLDRT